MVAFAVLGLVPVVRRLRAHDLGEPGGVRVTGVRLLRAQPVTAAVLAAVAVALEWAPACTPLRRGGSCLACPGVGDLGAVGVFAGLYLVVASEPAATSSRDPVDPAPLLSAEKSSSEALGP